LTLTSSIIIPNYNRAEALYHTLQALTKQTVDKNSFEVIIVDDGSQDNSLNVVQNFQAPYTIQLIQQPNQGPGAARNIGATTAKSGFFIFLDADMIAGKSLISAFQKMHEISPQAVLIGRQLPYPSYDFKLLKEFYYPVLAFDLGSNPIRPPFHALASGNCAVDRISFEILHGFDEKFRMAEDIEFGFRAVEHKISILYQPLAVGYHKHLKSLNNIFQQSRSSGWWTARLIQKHPEILGQIPIYRVLEPVDFSKDSASLQIQKLIFFLFSTRTGLWTLNFSRSIFESVFPSPRLLRYVFLRTLMANMRIGFTQGLRGLPVR
jgi:glycosyltransferase involved in cell wall biosynthesis